MIYNYLYFLFIYEFVITGYIYIRNFINIFVYIAIWYFIYKQEENKKVISFIQNSSNFVIDNMFNIVLSKKYHKKQ